jgi:hypothetical protein
METQDAPRPVFVARLVLGLGQGLALYLLFSAFDLKSWPATEPLLFAPLAIVALFVPLLVSQALGNMRLRTLLVWAVAATVLLAGLAWYDVWHLWPGNPPHGLFPPGIVPTAHTIFICGLFLFMAHALVSCGDADRRIVARYTTLFDLAWKLGVQLAIIVAFTAAFWIMLGLGIALFEMIKLHGFGRFIAHPWVWIPLTTIAAGAAIHITDTRASLVRGVRTLALTLLGWLLPVIALIAFAFLISLVFTGLEPLWQTRSATLLLLAAAAALIIHINAAYQDGDVEHRPPHILRVAGTLGAVLLIFIVWIAAYALWLRVDQYGWSVDRIYSAACVLVGGMFAVGYLIAALLPGYWLKLIERWNVYGTFVFLAVLFALSTPIADPMRLSVADQTARLESGAVKPTSFDYAYLRWHGGRFGHEALAALMASKDSDIREAASIALHDGPFSFAPVKRKPIVVGHAINVWPKGRSLPAAFLKTDWSQSAMSYAMDVCVSGKNLGSWQCDAWIGDIDGDGKDEILFVYGFNDEKEHFGTVGIFRQVNGTWRLVGDVGMHCRDYRTPLIAGRLKAVPPLQMDLMVDGVRHIAQPRDVEPLCSPR